MCDMLGPVPNRDQALVAEEKIRDYLLSSAHPIGRHKARFFSRLGYRQDDWMQLVRDLKAILREGSVVNVEKTIYGDKYIVEGALKGPHGVVADVTTVWVIKAGEDFPRLVTAYPGV